jgi:hypothetical protein
VRRPQRLQGRKKPPSIRYRPRVVLIVFDYATRSTGRQLAQSDQEEFAAA